MIDREGPIHRAVLAYLRSQLPSAVIHHSPNAIGLSGKRLMLQIVKNTAAGTVTGFPDLLILDAGRCGLMEVKAAGNYPSKPQSALLGRLEALGYPVAVVCSIDDARAALVAWGWVNA